MTFRGGVRAALPVCLTALVLPPAAPARPRGVPAFWQRVAVCETGARWNWGALRRPGEGHLYEGGPGFYYQTWTAWAKHVPAARPYRHAYLAPPWVQALVAEYGLAHHGYWGSLHNGCAG